MTDTEFNDDFFSRLLIPVSFINDEYFNDELARKYAEVQKVLPEMDKDVFKNVYYNAIALFIFQKLHSALIPDNPSVIDDILKVLENDDFAATIKVFCKKGLAKRDKAAKAKKQ